MRSRSLSSAQMKIKPLDRPVGKIKGRWTFSVLHRKTQTKFAPIVSLSLFSLDPCSALFCFTDCQNLFGIIYRCPREMKEKLLMFRLVGDEINKQEWLQKLTTGLANTACMADTVRPTHPPIQNGNNFSPLPYITARSNHHTFYSEDIPKKAKLRSLCEVRCERQCNWMEFWSFDCFLGEFSDHSRPTRIDAD